MKGDAAYFSERAKQERAAAMQAANLRVREVHLEMAKRYDELAEAIAVTESAMDPEIAA